MKKSFLAVLMCSAIALPVILSGCGTTPLEKSPSTTASTQVYGSALTYNTGDNKYVYFANAFQSAEDMEDGYDAKNTALKRIALNENGKIVTDEKTTLPKNIETVLEKVVGSDHTFMYSSGKYIYFATPCNDIDSTTRGEHLYTYNQYYRVNTDGTNLTKFYTSTSVISQQNVLNIEGKEYLVLVDNSKLIKIELGENISQAVTLAENFTSVIFASSYVTAGDEIAYYTTELPEEEVSSRDGQLLFAVNIATGENLGGQDNDKNNLAINNTKPRDITLKLVKDGSLFFTTTDASLTVYARLNNAKTFDWSTIETGLDDITEFQVVVVQDHQDTPQSKQVYYVFADSDADKTYALPSGTLNLANNELINNEIDVIFTYNEYMYFTYSDSSDGTGIYRISVRDGNVQIITDMENIKTTNISYDGQYIYYFAQTSFNEETSDTYYMHRSDTTLNIANSELLSDLLDDDKPSTDNE